MAGAGNLRKMEGAHPRAVTGAIRSATMRLKTQGRREIARAFRGRGTTLPNAWRGKVVGAGGQDITRRGVDPDPIGTCFSKAIVKPRGVDLIEVFETGA